MNTIKTSFVVVVILAMGYGGWMLLSGKWKLSTPSGSSVLPLGVSRNSNWADSLDIDTGQPNGDPATSAELNGNWSEAPAFDQTADLPKPDGFPVRDASGGGAQTGGPADSEMSRVGSAARDPFRDRPSNMGVEHVGFDQPSPQQGTPQIAPQVLPEDVPEEGFPADAKTMSPTVSLPGASGEGAAGQLSFGVSRSRKSGSEFAAAWRKAIELLEADRLRDALYTLSTWVGSSDLTPEEDARLKKLLDELAGTVIFSGQHLMEPAYVVRREENLQEIAASFHVPWQLLAYINGISNPEVLLPGQRLKVIRGPFTARVDLAQQEVVLYLRGHYAGRFPFSEGRDQPPRPGTYKVVSKMLERTAYDERNQEIPPGDPSNPYGSYWIDLGSNQSIHAIAPSGPGRGCIALAPRNAQDLFAVLSLGSQVAIR